MKKLSVVLFCLLTACGSQDEKAAQPEAATQSEQWRDNVPAQVLAKVPQYVIERTNYETGVVEYAYTNEAPAEIGDLSTEEGRLAYGKAESERFARGTLVTVQTLANDDDIELLKSSESFFFGGCGLGFGIGGFGFGFGGLGGCGGWGGFGFRGFGLGGPWGWAGGGWGGGWGGGCGFW